MRQGRMTVIAIAVLGSAIALGTASGPEAAGEPRVQARAFPGQLSRIASVRVYQSGRWTLPGENAASVGRALASLQPTWISDLIRYPKRLAPTGREVRAWNTITDLVRESSPSAQFGIELNALQYKTAAEIERKMSQIRTRFNNDGWMIDFYSSGYRRFPAAVEAAIDDAHANGEWIGGNVFGLAAGPKVPPGSDFVAVQDFGFKVDLRAVRRLAREAPVMYHLGNNPQAASSDGCRWINELDTHARIEFLRHRASQQATYDFHVGYPVLFPGCERHPERPRDPGLVYYNAARDGPMLKTIDGLMDRFAG